MSDFSATVTNAGKAALSDCISALRAKVISAFKKSKCKCGWATVQAVGSIQITNSAGTDTQKYTREDKRNWESTGAAYADAVDEAIRDILGGSDVLILWPCSDIPIPCKTGAKEVTENCRNVGITVYASSWEGFQRLSDVVLADPIVLVAKLYFFNILKIPWFGMVPPFGGNRIVGGWRDRPLPSAAPLEVLPALSEPFGDESAREEAWIRTMSSATPVASAADVDPFGIAPSMSLGGAWTNRTIAESPSIGRGERMREPPDTAMSSRCQCQGDRCSCNDAS